jgi:hypothetical protein
MITSSLPAAVRAYAVPPKRKHSSTRTVHRPEKWPAVLVLDTETTTDAVQQLLFGVYRYCRWTNDGVLDCREEGVFYADDLPDFDPAGFATLREYVRTSVASGTAQRGYRLRFLSRREFMDRVFFKLAYRARALVVGFNLPFDLSRIAINASAARSKRHASLHSAHAAVYDEPCYDLFAVHSGCIAMTDN